MNEPECKEGDNFFVCEGSQAMRATGKDSSKRR